MHAAVEHPLLANTTVARRRLDRVVAELTTHVADQSAVTLVLRDATQHQYARRETLFSSYLLPLSRVASVDAFVTAAFSSNPGELARWHATKRLRAFRARTPALTRTGDHQ